MMSSPALIANEFKTNSPKPKHDRLSFGSQWKGKAKEDRTWQLEWWDLCTLSDKPPPVVWSRSSMIFTAHPTEPKVIAHLFPSSKPCTVPSPPQILSTPASYQPPTVISVSLDDQWLFGYFPGKDCEGIACLWKKGHQVDDWVIKEVWTCARGAGILAASWIGQERECIAQETGSSARLPRLGPPAPVSSPTLIFVTEAYQVHARYLRYGYPELRSLVCSLSFTSSVSEREQSTPPNTSLTPGGIKVCTEAAIGLSYEDTSIIIAVRSRVLPLLADQMSYHGMDLNMPLDMTQSQPSFADSGLSLEWETWGETPSIDLCEVHLDCDGLDMRLTTTPLPSISHSQSCISKIMFIPVPPYSAPDSTVSPTLSVRSAGSTKKDSDTGSMHGSDRGKAIPLYLAAAVLDFGDYTSTPKSELIVYALRRSATTSPTRSPWSSRIQASRSFTSGLVTFISPPPPGIFSAGLLVGIMDTAGTIPKSKLRPKQSSIGTLEFLRLSDLSNNDMWGRCSLLGDLSRIGKSFPQAAAVSPNHGLICTVPGSLDGDIHPVVHPLSIPLVAEESMLAPQTRRLSVHLSTILVSSMCAQRSTADITYILSLSSTPLPELEEALYITLSTFNSLNDGLWDMWLEEVLGVATETYRARAKATDSDTIREDLSLRWQVAHDALSLAACSAAFEDCREGDDYDLNAVWGLIGVCNWAIQFIEKLSRECILCDPASSAQLKSEEQDDLFGSNPLSPAAEREQIMSLAISPTLLHLVHPHMLSNLVDVVGYMKTLKNYVISLPAGGEHAHLAKTVLLDLFDSSGVDIPGLYGVLESLRKMPQNIPNDILLRSLTSCKPSIAMHLPVRQAVLKVLDAHVMDKPRLFIKPSNLVHGLSKLSAADEDSKEKERDVLTKSIMSNNGPRAKCIRCGGLSEAAQQIHSLGQSSDRWRAWEKTWTIRCICGGMWSNV